MPNGASLGGARTQVEVARTSDNSNPRKQQLMLVRRREEGFVKENSAAFVQDRTGGNLRVWCRCYIAVKIAGQFTSPTQVWGYSSVWESASFATRRSSVRARLAPPNSSSITGFFCVRRRLKNGNRACSRIASSKRMPF